MRCNDIHLVKSGKNYNINYTRVSRAHVVGGLVRVFLRERIFSQIRTVVIDVVGFMEYCRFVSMDRTNP